MTYFGKWSRAVCQMNFYVGANPYIDLQSDTHKILI